jgi:hypothetical protein
MRGGEVSKQLHELIGDPGLAVSKLWGADTNTATTLGFAHLRIGSAVVQFVSESFQCGHYPRRAPTGGDRPPIDLSHPTIIQLDVENCGVSFTAFIILFSRRD